MEFRYKAFPLIIFITANILTNTNAQVWTSPFFLPSGRNGVEFGDFTSNVQYIKMDEELEPAIDIAIINYDGDTPPVLSNNYPPTHSLLDAKIERNGNQWKVVVKNKQDYENLDMQRYVIDITINGVTKSISISLVNIIDNDPVLSSISNSCLIDELKKDFTSDCAFNVYDPDGVSPQINQFSFVIIGSFGEDKLFSMVQTAVVNQFTLKFNLFVNEELDYSLRTLYNFRIDVYDIAKNNNSLNTIVNVNDVPNMDPIWMRPFSTARFDEKQEMNFEVNAIDGDTFINKTIWYELEFEPGKDYSNLIKVEKETGKITVASINRDTLKNEFFPFRVFAYKYDNHTWGIHGSASLIIDDINDNAPVIDLQPEILRIREAEYLTLPFSKFTINDIDLGSHATYDVILTKGPDDNEPYSSAFNIVPSNGYQETRFSINVLNATLLDYENPLWQKFTILVRAIENENPGDHTTEKALQIELINWNDEIPEFEKMEYTAFVPENASIDHLIESVLAIDGDIDDYVKYSLVGGINNILGIRANGERGEIYTKVDNVFDYERQTELMVQIQAEDTLQTIGETLHRVYTQLTINVVDVNDETPDIRMPRIFSVIEENSKGNTVVTQDIVAIDPDTNADLHFEIVWEDSYAMNIKSGEQADTTTYEGCFVIETVPDTINNVTGRLVVNPEFIASGRDIDYEEYEIMYLTIRIIDRNQIIGSDRAEGVLTVRISDVNDNAPRFISDTLTTLRSVVEEALNGTLVGTIFAIDDDGPGNNVIVYSIEPANIETPDNWIAIDSATGVLTVMANQTIDCDDPKIDDLLYTIKLTDGVWNANGMIKINIVDINNKYPQIDDYEDVVEIYENATTADLITIILANDIDRDEPHNVIQYTINYVLNPALQKFFVVDETSGDLIVNLQGDNHLDRDEGTPVHDIHINVYDNYKGNGRRNSNETMVQVILLDVNDKKPEMPSESTIFMVTEDREVGEVIENQFYAPDKDDPDTPNAHVSYEILSITAGGNNLPDREPSGIFTVESYGTKYARILVGKELKGYHGDWKLEIRAFDHGDEWKSRISLSSTATYTVRVEPHNYNIPEITYPLPGQSIRLRHEDLLVNRVLKLYDGSNLPNFEAKDEDGGRFGNVSFEIRDVIGSTDSSFFAFEKINDKESRLILQKEVTAKTYRVNIVATDDSGAGKSSTLSNLGLAFIDMNGLPYYEIDSFSTDFTENSTGLGEERQMPYATDPKNVESTPEDEKVPVYYFIHNTFNSDGASYFELNKDSGILTLVRELDRETAAYHEIKIVATNNVNGPQYPVPEASMLLIKIKVNDVNDNPPNFDTLNYASGIASTDYVSKVILTVHATDLDETPIISYFMVPNSITTSPDSQSIEGNKENMFSLNSATGELSLRSLVTTSMRGYFIFRVEAVDEVGHTDECTIKIYIVAESNRVTFVFFNTLEEVNNNTNKQFLADTFRAAYQYDESNIDDVTKYVLDNQESDDLTNVRVHFIQDNEAVEASLVQSRTSDLNFLTNLQLRLNEHALRLNDVPSKTEDQIQKKTNILQIMLIISTAVLGLLCIVLAAAFAIRTRNLNRELKARDFGSVSSNLNRREAPTTNFFAVEGSNPVLNHNTLMRSQFDDLSIQSDESDFVGIEDDPTFRTKNSAYGNGDFEKNENPLAHVEFDDGNTISSKF